MEEFDLSHASETDKKALLRWGALEFLSSRAFFVDDLGYMRRSAAEGASLLSVTSLQRRDLAWILGLALVFLVSVPLVDPRGDFPLNDDWSFALTARHFFSQGDWRPTGWASMPQITHTFWAAPACMFFGCTFEALRWSTLGAALLLLVCAFSVFRLVTSSCAIAGLATIVTVFNPVVYALSFTFMTDVLFEALMLAATLFFVKAFRTDSTADVALATAFSIAATLCRQLGLCIPIAFCVSYWLVSESPLVRRVLRGAAPAILCATAIIAYETWLRHSGRMPALYDKKSAELIEVFRSPGRILQNLESNGIILLTYLGLFCLPVLIWLSPADDDRRPPRRFKRSAIFASIIVGVIAAILIVRWRLMPLAGNILNPEGIGPPTLRDDYILHSNNLARLPSAFWIVVTAASLVGAWLLIQAIGAVAAQLTPMVRERRLSAELAPSLFGTVALVTYVSPLLIAGFFDRYLAVVVPQVLLALIPVMAPSTVRPQAFGQAGAAFVCAGLTGAFAVLSTHDYLSWNRARWRAIADLEGSAQANARTLDGGFEYNGYRSYDPAYTGDPRKSWWWVQQDDYQITFGPLPGLEVAKRYAYSAYLMRGQRYIYVLKRPATANGARS